MKTNELKELLATDEVDGQDKIYRVGGKETVTYIGPKGYGITWRGPHGDYHSFWTADKSSFNKAVDKMKSGIGKATLFKDLTKDLGFEKGNPAVMRKFIGV